MRPSLFPLVACIVLSTGFPASAFADEAQDVAAILQAERDICAAFEREDAGWLEAHLGPGFTLTSSAGKVTTTADEVADLRGGTQYDVFRNRDTQVRVYGDAAVTTGITRVEGKSDGQPYALEFQFTDTWIRKPQGWVMVASHASRRAQ